MKFNDEIPKIFEGLPKVISIILVLLGVLYFISGIYVVEAHEMGVVFRFGAPVELSPPGIGYHLPWPISSLRKVNIKEVQSITVGFWKEVWEEDLSEYNITADDLAEYVITGDKNIIHDEYSIQYRNIDAMNFITSSKDMDAILKSMAQAAILSQVAQRSVDTILTTGKREMEYAVKENLNQRLKKLGLKTQILSVERKSIAVPFSVKSSFQDVISAREEKRSMLNEAQTYGNTIIPKAKGEARRLLTESKAEKFKRISAAKGESKHFLNVLQEYKTAPKLMRQRMFLDVAEKVFPRLKILVLAKDKRGKYIKLKLMQDPVPTSPRLR